MQDNTISDNGDSRPFIVRQFLEGAPVRVQVREFYDRWMLFNETKREFEQTELNMMYAAKNNITLIGDASDLKRDQRERTNAIPILKVSVLEALERVKILSDEALRTLPPDERINLRWALHSLSQLQSREEALAQLQLNYANRERDHDRER